MLTNFSPGTLVDDRYRIVRLLGKGGMGKVWEALDEDSTVLNEQRVALKFLSDDSGGQAGAKTLDLHQEVSYALRVTHPNVCRIYGFENYSLVRLKGEESDKIGPGYMIMEYIGGENLNSLIRRFGRFPRRKSIELCLQICDGLIAIHSSGITHSDLTPNNVQIDEYGQVKLMDFGVSAEKGGNSRGGTLAYMSPEQLSGKAVSEKSDIYSLGLVMYNLFCGELFPAFSPGNIPKVEELLDNEKMGSLPEEVRWLILNCTKEDPAARPKDVAAIKKTLENSLNFVGWKAEPGGRVPSYPELILERKIDRRAWGDVWLAREQNLDEPRILKFCDGSSQLPFLEKELVRYRQFVQVHGSNAEMVFRVLRVNLVEPPFFLELECQGESIQQEKESIAGLDEKAKIEVICEITGALVAVHGAGLLHLDLKASSIYIHYDSMGNPKLWLRDVGTGTSGLTSPDSTTKDFPALFFNGHDHLYRAPELFSKEQAATSRSDIFSLGVLIFQVLMGDLYVSPLGQLERVEDEILRSDLKEATRPDPDERLGFSFLLLAKVQNIELRRKRRQVESLEGKVRAEKRLRLKQGRTNWTLAAMLTAGIIGLLILGVFFVEVRSQRDSLQRTLEFTNQVLEIPDPTEGIGEFLSAENLLEMSAILAGSELESQPEVKQRIYSTLGLGLQRLGNYETSYPLLEEARLLEDDVQNGRLEEDARVSGMAKRRNALAEHYRIQGDLAQAAKFNGEALELLEESRNTRLYAWVMETKGLIQQSFGNYQGALPIHQEVTALRRELIDPNSLAYTEVAVSLNNEGAALLRLRFYDQAVLKFEEALSLRQEILNSHKEILINKANAEAWKAKMATAMHNLALAESRRGTLVLDVDRLIEALEFSRKLLGADHPDIARTLNVLGRAYAERGNLGKAREFLEEALAIREDIWPDGSLETASSLQSLGWLASEEGEFEEAEKLYRRALNLRDAMEQPPTHPDVIVTRKDLAGILRNKGDIDEAVTLYETALNAWRAREDGEPEIPFTQTDLALALMAQGNSLKAIETAKDALEAWGEDPFGEAFGLARLALLYEDAGKLELAEKNFKAAIDGFREVLGPKNAVVAETMKKYARFLVDTNAQPAEEAERVAREAITAFESDETTPLWRLIHGNAVLGGALVKQGRLEEAQPILEEAYKNLQDIRGERNEETGDARRYLQELYRKQGNLEKVNELERNLTRAQTEGGRQAA